MIEHPLANLDSWIRYFEASDIPILEHTKHELIVLAAKGDDATIHELADIVRNDALLALQVLLYLQSHRSPSQLTDVTTVDRVILMIGVDPLLTAFKGTLTVEEHLKNHPAALSYVHLTLQRAHHAAACAGLWAGYRHDTESAEVMTASLLRDIAECLLACFAPKLALRVKAMQRIDHRLRSKIAQKTIFNFSYIDLQLKLIESWRLPPILKMLMDENLIEHPRAKTVATAVSYARHAANGWDDEALPDDYAEAASLTGLTTAKLIEVTHETSRKCTEKWRWCDDKLLTPPPREDLANQ